jgi:hypothetical protein
MTDPNGSSLDSANAPFERRAAFAAWILSGGDLDPPYGPPRERALCAPGRAAIALSRQLCPDQTRHLSDWAILSDEPVFDWLTTHDLCTGQAALETDWLVTYLLLGLARFPFIRELTPFTRPISSPSRACCSAKRTVNRSACPAAAPRRSIGRSRELRPPRSRAPS